MALAAMKQNKKIILVIPDESVRIALTEYLESVGLSHVMLSCILHSKLNQFEFENFKKDIFSKIDVYKISHKAQFEYQRIYAKTQDIFEKKFKITTEGKTWRNFIDEYISFNADDKVNLIIRYLDHKLCPKSELELDHLLDIVQEGMQYYAPHFQSLQNSELKKYINFSKLKLNELNDLTHDIFTIREEVMSLRDHFLNVSKDIEEAYIKDQLDAVHLLEYLCESTIHDYTQYKLKPQKDTQRFLSGIFQNKQNESSRQLGELFENCSRIANKFQSISQKNLTKPSQEDQIISFCEQTLENLKVHLLSLKQSAPELIKSVNRFNHNNPILSELENELIQLINHINSRDILCQKLEVNTLSFAKQVDYTVDLVSKFDLILSEIEENIQYFQWCDYLENLEDHHKHILKVLTRFETSEWAEISKAWYLYHQITSNFLHLSTWTDEDKAQLTELYKKETDEWINNKISSIQERKALFVNSLKNTDSESFKYFTSKNQKEPWTWRYLLNQKFELTSTVYPVMITDDDDLNHMIHTGDVQLVVYNKKTVNAEIMQLFDKVTYFWEESAYVGKPDFGLILKQSESKSHALLSTSERLGTVRTIAHLVMSAKSLPKVYLMKDTCVLSYASNLVNTHILNVLHDMGIKKLFVEDDPYKILLGALLEAEKNIFVITEDQLLHPEVTSNIMDQLFIIDQLEQYGCQLLNVSVSDFFKNKNPLDQITEAIFSAQDKSNTPNKKQLSFEFI